jgi:hypothetical protein
MISHRENARFTCLWISALAVAAATGCGSGGSGDPSTTGAGGNGGALPSTTTSTGAPTSGGTGGSNAGSTTGAATTTGSGGSSTTASTTGTGGAPPSGACPANATFCSGFEEAGLPAGAVYKVNAAPGDWSRDFEIDSSMHHAGAASLRVKASTEAGTSGSAYKMLAVPSPVATFWVRFYIWSEVDLGAQQHNPFAEASNSDDPNADVAVEFADDVGIAFNSHDNVVRPKGASINNPFTLPKGKWHCIEIAYDSAARHQQLFINGDQQIDVTDWPAASQVATPFKVVKIGFNELHGPPRKTWYDDVVVAPQRIPCF